MSGRTKKNTMEKEAAWRAYNEERRCILGHEVGDLPFPAFDTVEDYNGVSADQFVNLARLANELRRADFSEVERKLFSLCTEFFVAVGGFNRMEAMYSQPWCNQVVCYFQYFQSGMGRSVYLSLHLKMEQKRSAELEKTLGALRSESATLRTDMTQRAREEQGLCFEAQKARIQELNSKVADAWATTRALRVQKEQAHSDHVKSVKALEGQVSELRARSADFSKEKAAFEEAVAKVSASLDLEKARGKELVLDINAMGQEVACHFKALQREEDRAIAAEARAAEAEARAAEAEADAAEAELSAVKREARLDTEIRAAKGEASVAKVEVKAAEARASAFSAEAETRVAEVELNAAKREAELEAEIRALKAEAAAAEAAAEAEAEAEQVQRKRPASETIRRGGRKRMAPDRYG